MIGTGRSFFHFRKHVYILFQLTQVSGLVVTSLKTRMTMLRKETPRLERLNPAAMCSSTDVCLALQNYGTCNALKWPAASSYRSSAVPGSDPLAQTSPRHEPLALRRHRHTRTCCLGPPTPVGSPDTSCHVS